MIIIGIDPGLSGAVAILGYGQVRVFDIPTFTRGIIKKQRRIDCRSLYLSLESLACQEEEVIVFLEDVHAMPRQGVTSMFSMGHTLGAIKGIIASLGFDTVLVSPQKWKKYFKLTKDKESSRTLALVTYPTLSDSLKRKKDSDRAEALLIAWYGSIMLDKGGVIYDKI